MFNFADVSAKNKEALDLMMKNYATITKGFQAIAVEAADYSKNPSKRASPYAVSRRSAQRRAGGRSADGIPEELL